MSENLVIKSPLKAWPGGIELPNPDDFNGVHWQVWKDAFNEKKRKGYAITHVNCYAGLELLASVDGWNIVAAVGKGTKALPIEEVQAWETEPENERVKLVAWLGRTMLNYMDVIIDPKE
jgi:hypothetical protein